MKRKSLSPYFFHLCASFIFLLNLNFSCPYTLEAAVIPVGAGAYTTDLPAGQLGPSNRNNLSVIPKLVSGSTQLPTTNTWWSSLIWSFNPENPWSENLFAHPLSFRARANGLEVGYPTIYNVTPFNTVARGHKVQEYHYPHVRDLTLSVAGLNAPDTKVLSYSDWTVTAQWNSSGRQLIATMGSGLPFVYVTPNGGDTVITYPAANATIWRQQNEVIGITVNGHHYGIFAPQGSTWTVASGQLRSSLNGKNYYSVAVLPDNKAATVELFRKHAYAFVTDTKVAWSYDQNKAVLTTTYTAKTDLKEPGPNNSNVDRPLMALYRHQWLNSADPVLAFTYRSPKGLMKLVDANQFTTQLTFNGVLPFLPLAAKDKEDGFNQNQLYGYIDAIYKQTPGARWGIDSGSDTYWTGKALNRIAQLIPIAEQVKHTAARDLFLSEVKAELQNWFDGRTSKLFYYNNTWKTLIGFPASYGSNTQLNDHNFHYGYYVMAAALVAHYDPVWASTSQWGGMVELLVKDVNNPSRTDSQFPFLRDFDVYAGHSWASGAAAFASGNNQESSSEALNFAGGLILWGTITNNTALRNLGIYLYTTETSAVKQYWFDIDNQVFPTEFQPNTVGIVWGSGGAYSIWWDGTVQELHGINFLPITPTMLYLGGFPDYLRANQTFMMNNNGAATAGTWRDIHMSVKALYDPQAAIREFNANSGYTPEGGESKAHTYHWIHNINALGQVDTTITADIPTYQVFKKNGVVKRVAYNPSAAPLKVTFSDGVSFTVPAKAVASDDSASSTHDFTSGLIASGLLAFWFQPNWETKFVNFNYRLNGGALTSVPMANYNGQWRYTLTSLKAGDKIEYFYTYEDNGGTVTSETSQYTYQTTITPTPTPTPTETVLDDNANYKLSLVRIDTGVKVVFAPKEPSSFVDIHYTINGGTQQNVRMTNVSGRWEREIKNLPNNALLDLFFTYTRGTPAYDTKHYTYTYTSTTTGLLDDLKFTKGVDKYAGQELRFWFKPEQGQTNHVHVHYRLNHEETFSQYQMAKQDDHWEFILYDPSSSPVVDYFFSYEKQGLTNETEWEEQLLEN